MRRSLIFAAGVVVAVGLACIVWVTHRDRFPSPEIGRVRQSAFPGKHGAIDGQPAPVRGVPATLATTRRPPLADALGAPDTPPDREPAIVLDVLAAYRRSCGGFPVGEDNRQIVRALLGTNSARLPFLPTDHPRLNPNGELLDAWGTPFFFHLLARDRIEVRSAGPDREFYSADDLTAPTLDPESVTAGRTPIPGNPRR